MLPTKRGKKFIATAVWLSYNSIQTTGRATAILQYLIEDPQHLAWLDLSFNEVYDIDEVCIE